MHVGGLRGGARIGRDVSKKSETRRSRPPANTTVRARPVPLEAVVVHRQRSLPPDRESASLVRTGRPAGSARLITTATTMFSASASNPT